MSVLYNMTAVIKVFSYATILTNAFREQPKVEKRYSGRWGAFPLCAYKSVKHCSLELLIWVLMRARVVVFFLYLTLPVIAKHCTLLLLLLHILKLFALLPLWCAPPPANQLILLHICMFAHLHIFTSAHLKAFHIATSLARPSPYYDMKATWYPCPHCICPDPRYSPASLVQIQGNVG